MTQADAMENHVKKRSKDEKTDNLGCEYDHRELRRTGFSGGYVLDALIHSGEDRPGREGTRVSVG